MVKTVADVMSRDPILVRPDTPIQEAIQIIAERHISGLPTVDETGKLVGILSETDLMWRETGATPPPYITILDSVIFLENPKRYEKELHKVLGQTVGEVMTTQHIVTTTPDCPLQDAARLMHEKKVHRLPVLDDSKKVVGILTRGDIVRAMAASHDSES
ncbi:phosphoribulokinase [Leptolyngbya valderiana BDU 20041]|uniref:CBS domain-containing protein n=1 Tax=Baaleninema simplex TaxID=2862350 RepID=UPI00034C52C0|nr:CBS domain-containing protein [Baaleninema simplex]MDC0834584.1 CBS domain-containing protein [Geitlerinema sp. CS-897]OAB62297.1 phosphoribulokinase [Leptolyngbya valderiana BDU 20041]PPT06265.1 Inosine-5'-monophosphate dehydrogenase [Geitlerinema sp. FC II]